MGAGLGPLGAPGPRFQPQQTDDGQQLLNRIQAGVSGHSHAGLVALPDGSGGFKGQYEIEMSRVLQFEAALQR